MKKKDKKRKKKYYLEEVQIQKTIFIVVITW